MYQPGKSDIMSYHKRQHRECTQYTDSLKTVSINSNSKRTRRGSSHPPGLKGKEIGLWYARKNKRTVFKMQRKIKEEISLNATTKELESKKCFKNECNLQVSDLDHSNNNERESRRPPGLKGKEIGLWYARNGGSKNANVQDVQPPQVIALNEGHSEDIENVLLKLENEKQALLYDSLGTETSLSAVAPKIKELSLSNFQREYLRHIDEAKLNDMGKIETPFLKLNLIKNNPFDRELSQAHKNKFSSQKYLEMLKKRKQLPAYERMEEIIQTVAQHQVVVITGETGCGKTTQVPQFILDSFINSNRGSLCHIICTQPRRISAISVAERVAEERDERCGSGTVGYQIRLESKLPSQKGSILFCTTGIVLQYLQGDPYLSGASHLILDEVHERNLQTDFLITIVKDLTTHRPDLKIILMSATLNAEAFSKYFGKCPMLNIPGFTYPVEEFYLEDVLEKTKYKVVNQSQKKTFGKKNFSKCSEYYDMKVTFLREVASRYSSQTITSLQYMDEEEINIDLMKELIKHICLCQPDGAILVFLPGWSDISKLNTLLINDRFYSRSSHLIIPLHSMMPTINQREVFERPPHGVRKIILATNIAETSITIDDIVYVVDCGKIKMTNFDAENNISTLKPEWVSLANARQRRGRAGRVQPGICYHMYTSLRENFLDAYQLPEIQRTRLEELCLHVKMLKLGKFEPFTQKIMDPPSLKAVASAICLLQKLNALDSEEMLTPLGYHLAKLPLDPQTGKMILFGAMFGCLDPILTVAASLSFKDAFVCPLGKEKEVDLVRRKMSRALKSDHLMLINAYDGWENSKRHYMQSSYCRDNFLSVNTLKMLEKMKEQLARYLYDSKMIDLPDPKFKHANVNSGNVNLLRAIICAGLYPNVAQLKIINGKRFSKRPPQIRTQEDGRVEFHLKSVNCREYHFESPWLVYHQKLKSTGIFLHDTTMVPPLPLIFFGGEIGFTSLHIGDVITVDKYMEFRCNEKTANLILKLRAELDTVLDHKIKNPGSTEWNLDKREGAIMGAIVDLITSEEALTVKSNDK